ncbi:MAG: hypothetical protein NVS4B11_33850 [Ktedonobacteraceae bacterium]
MNMRLLGITLLVVMMIGGLVAGTFAHAIERALTVPAHVTQIASPLVVTKKTTPVAVMPVTGAPVDNVLAQDLFQRADQPLWGTATDHRAWNGDANSAPHQNVFSIVNMVGQIANGQGTFNALLGSVHSNAEVMLRGSLNHFNAGAVNLGVVLRWQDTNNWYKALIDGTNVVVLKRVGGATTRLAAVPFPAKDGKVYTLRFRAVGATLFAKVWRSTLAEPAQWTMTVNDTDLTIGQTGIRVLVQQETIVQIASFIAIAAKSGM